jgi:homospermidine synthase
MVGFGCIEQGVLPLLLRRIDMRPPQILIVSPEPDGAQIARSCGVERLQVGITAYNPPQVLWPLLARGDFLPNLSVDVSTTALIRFPREVGAL